MIDFKYNKISLSELDAIFFDFDGVFTNNKVFVFEDGKEAVLCDRSDGLAINKLKSQNIPVYVMSTETNNVVLARCKKLKIEVFHGITDKKRELIKIADNNGFLLSKIMFVGNDINDLDVMKEVGFPVCVNDAHKTIKNISKVILSSNGGDAAIK